MREIVVSIRYGDYVVVSCGCNQPTTEGLCISFLQRSHKITIATLSARPSSGGPQDAEHVRQFAISAADLPALRHECRKLKGEDGGHL